MVRPIYFSTHEEVGNRSLDCHCEAIFKLINQARGSNGQEVVAAGSVLHSRPACRDSRHPSNLTVVWSQSHLSIPGCKAVECRPSYLFLCCTVTGG